MKRLLQQATEMGLRSAGSGVGIGGSSALQLRPRALPAGFGAYQVPHQRRGVHYGLPRSLSGSLGSGRPLGRPHPLPRVPHSMAVLIPMGAQPPKLPLQARPLTPLSIM